MMGEGAVLDKMVREDPSEEEIRMADSGRKAKTLMR